MEQFIGRDAHKKSSVFVAVNEKGRAGEAVRVVHDRQAYRKFLGRLPPRSEIAEEASGSYSWLVDEMELSGHCPRLCNPIDRFPTAAHFASYAGLVPRVHSSGGRTHMGQVCGNVNRHLKWAFVETGYLIVINQRGLTGSHVARLYQRIKRAKKHQKAVVAVARHLAEAAWWVLTRQEVYREPHGPRNRFFRRRTGKRV